MPRLFWREKHIKYSAGGILKPQFPQRYAGCMTPDTLCKVNQRLAHDWCDKVDWSDNYSWFCDQLTYLLSKFEPMCGDHPGRINTFMHCIERKTQTFPLPEYTWTPIVQDGRPANLKSSELIWCLQVISQILNKQNRLHQSTLHQNKKAPYGAA